MKPIICIVGRPNVGKSTLFNRITRRRDALVDDQPGVTRDRHYGDATWDDATFTMVDTGGFIEGDDDQFAGHIRFQIEQAVQDADAVIMVFDGRSGPSPYDRDMLQFLRRYELPVYYVINKIDGPEKEDLLDDFYGLGVDDMQPISGAHGYGLHDLMDRLVAQFPLTEEVDEPDLIKVAVVGRPNVGKSSLINRILGQTRLVVSDVPGTTRDAVDSRLTHNGQQYLLIDTAGIRRKSKVDERLEKYSVIKSLRSLDRCDIALIVLDAEEGITEQDVTIAGYAHDRGCGAVFLLNKWDLVAKDTRTAKQFTERLQYAAKFMPYTPSLTISALTGQRVQKIFSAVDTVYRQYATRIETGPLNQVLNRAVTRNTPSLHRGRRMKFFYATQVGICPPTIVCFVSHPEAVHFSYKRYLLNQIREQTGLDKTPVKLKFKARSGRKALSSLFDKRGPKKRVPRRLRRK